MSFGHCLAVFEWLMTTFQKMAVKLGDVVPNFSAASTHGKIDFHTWCEVRISRHNFTSACMIVWRPASWYRLMTASNFACDCRAAGPSCSLTLLTTPQSAPQSWAGPRALLGSLQREESRWSPSAAIRWKTTTAGSTTSSATTGWLTSHTPLSLTRLGGDLVCLGKTISNCFIERSPKNTECWTQWPRIMPGFP